MIKDLNKREPLLAVKNLKMHFPVTRGFLGREVGQIKAVDDVTFTINRGETFGLVGESGCGKTTTGKCTCASARRRADRFCTRDRISRTLARASCGLSAVSCN